MISYSGQKVITAKINRVEKDSDSSIALIKLKPTFSPRDKYAARVSGKINEAKGNNVELRPIGAEDEII